MINRRASSPDGVQRSPCTSDGHHDKHVLTSHPPPTETILPPPLAWHQVLECCAWFDFNDMEVYASDDEGEGSRTSGSEELAWEEEQMAPRDHRELFHATLARAGLQLRANDGLPTNQPPTLLDPFRFQVRGSPRLM